MSLKTRLLFFYTSLTTGIVIFFGIAAYVMTSINLSQQMDQMLAETAKNVIDVTRFTNQGTLEVIVNLSVGDNVSVQVWGRNLRLLAYTGNISNLERPMDPLGLQTAAPIFRDVIITNAHMRVYSVPLLVGDRFIGTMQVGSNMAVIDNTLDELFQGLTVAALVGFLAFLVSGYLSTSAILSPLESVRQAALEITQTSDLSRRIPYEGNQQDEVGQLVQAFNLNLSRLERLIETQKRFLADVGHELRTPLTVIKGNVALMRRFGELDDESLTSIVQEVDRLTRLVEDLLLLAQAEAGKMPMARQPVDMDALILEVLQESRVLAREKVKLIVGDFDQARVCGDRDRLKQVVINLVSNGVKYTPKGGEVHVSLEKNDEQALLTVRDTGPGIPPEDLPHIFERFYRGEKSRKRSRDGSGVGLGLSIAYWIIRNHDGEIKVQSEVGKGTTFLVNLPLLLPGKECISDVSLGRQV